MKILAFADIHGHKTALEHLLKKAKKQKVELVICAGDITVFERGIDSMLRILDKTGLPVFIVHGNHESEEVMRHFVRKHKNIRFLHKKAYVIGDSLLIGYGGGGFSMTDREFEKTMKRYSKVLNKHRHFILVTHAPPYKTKIDLINRHHCGNKSIANFIKLRQPLIAISGHLHETEGKKDKIGKTLVINPGMRGVIIDI